MDPSVPIQDGLKAKLISITTSGPAAGRVFTRVPQGAPMPFVHVGDDQIMGDEETWEGSNDVASTIHVFSRSADKREVKMIAGAIRAGLRDGFTIAGHLIAEGPFTNVQYLTEADGLTEHAIITAEFKVVPTQ